MIQAPRGTKDILPSEIDKWHNVEDKFRKVTRLFGYQELRTPIFESTEVFSRSIGDNTDIVKKEMYTFMDKGENSITLRPEMTAALYGSHTARPAPSPARPSRPPRQRRRRWPQTAAARRHGRPPAARSRPTPPTASSCRTHKGEESMWARAG